MNQYSDRRERAPEGTEIDEDVTGYELERAVTDRLRTLSKTTATSVAKHLVMTHRLLDEDPELAYAHARAAAGRGSRVDVVREALGLEIGRESCRGRGWGRGEGAGGKEVKG